MQLLISMHALQNILLSLLEGDWVLSSRAIIERENLLTLVFFLNVFNNWMLFNTNNKTWSTHLITFYQVFKLQN